MRWFYLWRHPFQKFHLPQKTNPWSWLVEGIDLKGLFLVELDQYFGSSSYMPWVMSFLQAKHHVFHLPRQSAAHFVASNVSWTPKKATFTERLGGQKKNTGTKSSNNNWIIELSHGHSINFWLHVSQNSSQWEVMAIPIPFWHDVPSWDLVSVQKNPYLSAMNRRFPSVKSHMLLVSTPVLV